MEAAVETLRDDPCPSIQEAIYIDDPQGASPEEFVEEEKSGGSRLVNARNSNDALGNRESEILRYRSHAGGGSFGHRLFIITIVNKYMSSYTVYTYR
jgi:hypothetical protein